MQEYLGVSDLGGADLRDEFTSALLRVLTGTPVLRILSKLERTLDALDIEGLSSLWRSVTHAHLMGEQPSLLGTASNPSLGMGSEFWPSGMPAMSDWVDFLDTYLSPMGSKLDHSQPAPGNLRYYLQGYLLSATFKDCSIIIRVDRGQPTTPHRVTVIDLDPKSVHRLQKWEKLDEEITQAYLDVDKPKRCIDGGTRS
jgi:inositol-pentakisphosphate 2-kinase